MIWWQTVHTTGRATLKLHVPSAVVVLETRTCWIFAGDKYALVMKFVDHVFDDQVIDHLKLKVILPEGSTYVFLSLTTGSVMSISANACKWHQNLTRSSATAQWTAGPWLVYWRKI